MSEKGSGLVLSNFLNVEQGQKVLKEFIRLRLESVKGQLSGSVDINDESTYIDGSMYNI